MGEQEEQVQRERERHEAEEVERRPGAVMRLIARRRLYIHMGGGIAKRCVRKLGAGLAKVVGRACESGIVRVRRVGGGEERHGLMGGLPRVGLWCVSMGIGGAAAPFPAMLEV